MQRQSLFLITLLLLMAVPASAQSFPRKPAKENKSEVKQPDRTVTAQPVVDGDPVAVAADRITIEQLKQKLDQQEAVIILDVRANPDYRGSLAKIQGAIRIPPAEIDDRLKDLPKDKLIVTYCSCVKEETSGMIAQKMLDQGFKSVKALIGGFGAWENAGYPLEPKETKDKN